MIIIGIAGRARHGKNTAGDAMADELRAQGKVAVQVAFADAVKRAAKVTIVQSGLLTPEDVADALVSKPHWMRSLLQAIGESFRQVNPTFWITKVLEQGLPCDVLIITDVRYENEADEIRKRGGKILKMQRIVKDTDKILGTKVRLPYYAPGTDAVHPSESEVDLIEGDATIEAEGGMVEYIREMAREAARKWVP